MVDLTNSERNVRFSVIVDADEMSVPDAIDSVEDAYGKLLDLQQTGDRQKLLEAETAVKKAYVQIHNAIEEGDDCEFVTE